MNLKRLFNEIYSFEVFRLLTKIKIIATISREMPEIKNRRNIIVNIENSLNNPITNTGIRLQRTLAMII